MKKLTVKEILKMDGNDLYKMMTSEQYERMENAGFEDTYDFLEKLQESAEISGQKENEEHISIDEYLDYWEDMLLYNE